MNAHDCKKDVYVMYQPCKDNECRFLHQLETGALIDSEKKHYVQLKRFGTKKIYLDQIRLATLDEIKGGLYD